MKLSEFAIYQSKLRGLELRLSESTAEISCSKETVKRLKFIYRMFFILALFCFSCAAIASQQGLSNELIMWIVIFGVVFLFCALFERLLFPWQTMANILDLKCQCFRRKKRVLLFCDIQSVTVRRNTHNKRFRLAVVESIPDEELLSITVNIKFKGCWDPIIFGDFKSTEVAFRYCNDLVKLIGFNGTIEIDEQQTQ